MSDERRGGTAPVGDAIASWLRRAGLVRRIEQAQVVADWDALVGPQIAAVTRPESVTPDGLLRVRVATPAWATELGYMTPRILARLNTGRGTRIRDIRWLAGGTGEPIT